MALGIKVSLCCRQTKHAWARTIPNGTCETVIVMLVITKTTVLFINHDVCGFMRFLTDLPTVLICPPLKRYGES